MPHDAVARAREVGFDREAYDRTLADLGIRDVRLDAAVQPADEPSAAAQTAPAAQV